MVILEVITPGVWLDYEDREWNRQVDSLLDLLKSHFFEANTALNLLELDWQDQDRHDSARDKQHELDRERRAQIWEEVRKEFGDSFEAFDRIGHEAELRFKREKWGNGHVPNELQRPIIDIHAHAFLYALDGFEKALSVLAGLPGVDSAVSDQLARFQDLLPHLRHVRDSFHHREDRARGLDRRGNKMALQPIQNGIINAPGGGVLVGLGLNRHMSGTTIGCTMADGHYGEVEISTATLTAVRDILQDVLGSFKWRGGLRHEPSAS